MLARSLAKKESPGTCFLRDEGGECRPMRKVSISSREEEAALERREWIPTISHLRLRLAVVLVVVVGWSALVFGVRFLLLPAFEGCRGRVVHRSGWKRGL